MKYFVVIVAIFLLLFNFGCTEEPPTNTNVEPEKGLIYVNSNPPGAEIFLQGTSTGKFTPDSIINLAPDSYDLRVKLNEFADSSFEVSVNAGLKTTVYVDFIGYFGNLFVSSFPQGAEIFLQGNVTGKITPDSIINLAPDSYDLRIRLNEYADSSLVVNVKAGLKTTVDIDLTGTLSIGSNPSGAEIFFNNITTGRTTPATFDTLFPDIYEVTLKLEYFMDTSVTVLVRPGNQGLFISYSLTAGKITGIGSLPSGVVGSPENTEVALYLSIDDWLYDIIFASITCDGNGNYTLYNVTPGVYYMDAWKDNDNNGIWGSSGDYIWLHGTGIYPNYTLIPFQIASGAIITIDFELFVIP